MTTVDVREVSPQSFHITDSARTTTEHDVSVDPDYAQKLMGGKIEAAELVKESFEFLLQRESKQHYLTTLDITAISQHLPEYEREINKF